MEQLGLLMNYKIVRVYVSSETGICEQCGNLGELKPFGLVNDLICHTCYEKNGVASKLKEQEFVEARIAMDERVHGGYSLH